MRSVVGVDGGARLSVAALHRDVHVAILRFEGQLHLVVGSVLDIVGVEPLGGTPRQQRGLAVPVAGCHHGPARRVLDVTCPWPVAGAFGAFPVCRGRRGRAAQLRLDLGRFGHRRAGGEDAAAERGHGDETDRDRDPGRGQPTRHSEGGARGAVRASHATHYAKPLPAGARATVRCVAQVLLVEDDATIRSSLSRALHDLGHAVTSAGTAMDGLNQVVAQRPDVVVLDIGLPDLDGREMLRMLRAVSHVPVVVATARGAEEEIVDVLNSGADDYVVKPFGAGQLDARIRAVLRRGGQRSEPETLVVDGLRLDPAARTATLDGEPLELTPREFDVLHYLARRPGQVVSKRELLTEVWQLPYGGADKTVDVHVSWLRRKLGETAKNARYLHTVRGVGVRLGGAEEPGNS